MNGRTNKYQKGQQFFIRVETDSLPFSVRIKGYSEETNEYCVQRIGHVNTVWMTELNLEKYIQMADLK